MLHSSENKPLLKKMFGKETATERMAKRAPQTLNLERTPENKALIEKHMKLTKEINAIPEQIRGLPYGTPKMFRVARRTELLARHEELLGELLKLEKLMGFKA